MALRVTVPYDLDAPWPYDDALTVREGIARSLRLMDRGREEGLVRARNLAIKTYLDPFVAATTIECEEITTGTPSFLAYRYRLSVPLLEALDDLARARQYPGILLTHAEIASIEEHMAAVASIIEEAKKRAR